MIGIWACEQDDTSGTLSVDIKYLDKKQTTVTGLGGLFGEFLPSKSSLPIKFEIINVVAENGSSTEAVFEEVDVPTFIKKVTGQETPAELALKVDTVKLPAVSIEEFTGQLNVREGNRLLADKYHFDIKVSNVSGSAILKDALILEVKDFEIFGFSDFQGGAPVIERIGDSPDQILFTAFDEGVVIPADEIDFVAQRKRGFKGIFVDDMPEGELWSVSFPVLRSNTFVYLKGEQREIDFALGKPGNYKITFFK